MAYRENGTSQKVENCEATCPTKRYKFVNIFEFKKKSTQTETVVMLPQICLWYLAYNYINKIAYTRTSHGRRARILIIIYFECQ